MERLPKDILDMLKDYLSPKTTISHEMIEKATTMDELYKLNKSRGAGYDVYLLTFNVECQGLSQKFKFRYSYFPYKPGGDRTQNLRETIEKMKQRKTTTFPCEKNWDFLSYIGDSPYYSLSVEFSGQILDEFIDFLEYIVGSVPKDYYLGIPIYIDFDDNYR